MAEKGPWGSPEGAPKIDGQWKILESIQDQLKTALKKDGVYEVDKGSEKMPPSVTFLELPGEGNWNKVRDEILQLSKYAGDLAHQNNLGTLVVHTDDVKKKITLSFKN